MRRRAELGDVTRSDRSAWTREVPHRARVPAVPGYELGDLLARGATSEVWAGAEVAGGRRVVLKLVHATAGRRGCRRTRGLGVGPCGIRPHRPGRGVCPAARRSGRARDAAPARGSARRAGAGSGPSRGRRGRHRACTGRLRDRAAARPRRRARGRLAGKRPPRGRRSTRARRPRPEPRRRGRLSGVWGTDGYVAPEVVLGADPTPAADVYGVGALGWLCLTGQVPGPPGLRSASPTSAVPARVPRCWSRFSKPLSSPRPEHRPTAHELAWQLFRAAEPVALDLVRDDDPVSAVTYRLRAAAGSDAEPERPPRRTALCAFSTPAPSPPPVAHGGRLSHPAIPAGPRAAPASPDRHQPPRWAVPRRPGRHAARHGAPAPGVHADRCRRRVGAHRARAAPGLVLSVAALGAVERSTRGTWGERISGITGRAPPRTPAVATTPFDLRMDPRAPQQQPAELLERLAEHRAAAWRDGYAAHLHGSDAPRSPTAVRTPPRWPRWHGQACATPVSATPYATRKWSLRPGREALAQGADRHLRVRGGRAVRVHLTPRSARGGGSRGPRPDRARLADQRCASCAVTSLPRRLEPALGRAWSVPQSTSQRAAASTSAWVKA